MRKIRSHPGPLGRAGQGKERRAGGFWGLEGLIMNSNSDPCFIGISSLSSKKLLKQHIGRWLRRLDIEQRQIPAIYLDSNHTGTCSSLHILKLNQKAKCDKRKKSLPLCLWILPEQIELKWSLLFK